MYRIRSPGGFVTRDYYCSHNDSNDRPVYRCRSKVVAIFAGSRRPAMETPLTLNRRSMNSRDGKWARGSDTVVKVKGPSPSPLPRNSNGINCAERVAYVFGVGNGWWRGLDFECRPISAILLICIVAWWSEIFNPQSPLDFYLNFSS